MGKSSQPIFVAGRMLAAKLASQLIKHVIAFCTHCWAEIDSRIESCPSCGIDLSVDVRSYEDKIIAALGHPLPQARARICWLVGENRIRSVLPRLMEMAQNDPDIFVQKAAVEALGAFDDRRSDSLLRAISAGNDRFLASAAITCLRSSRRSQT
jgi:hypothetical protein